MGLGLSVRLWDVTTTQVFVERIRWWQGWQCCGGQWWGLAIESVGSTIELACLASRTCILMTMLIAAEGVFIKENPCNSLISLHDAFIWLEELLLSFGIQDPKM